MLLDDKYAKSILHVLYEHGPMTRKQVMELLKMRLNSLIEICNRLEEEDYIQRKNRDQIRNVPVMLNPKRFAFVGVEHAKDHVLCVLLDVNGKRVSSATFPLDIELGGRERMSEIVRIIRDFNSLQRGWEISGIGFSDIGIVNTELGTGVYSVHVADWENIPVRKILEQELGLFACVVDRSGASALDQLRTMPDSHIVRNSLQIYVGNGVGASILQNGKYWGAETPSSCQLGHTIAVPDGELCHCGNRGCVETLASIPSIVRHARELSKGKIRDEEVFFRKAAEGDRLCELVLREAGAALGVAIANVVTFTAITNVMIRSVLCKTNPVYFDAVREAITKNVIYPFSREITVQVNRQEEDCSALGAAYYAQKEYFSVERGFRSY